MERKQIARKSSIIGFCAQIATTLLSFLSRKIFLSTLGVDYLGLNSTLTQVLGTLAISELGIQTVIIFKLYRAVVDNDQERINEVMSAFRSLYRRIAIFIAGGSAIVLSLLKYIINDVAIPWSEVYIAWIIMAATSAVSYLLSYNGAIICADQKQYRISGVNAILNIIFSVVNILCLYLFANIFLYLCINMFHTITSNLAVYIMRKKYYPWVRLKKPQKEIQDEIMESAKDVFAGKIAGYIFNSTDNIVISSFLGTAVVGIVGNYTTIIYSIKMIISSIIGPIQALIGNYLVQDKDSDIEKFFVNFTYITYVIGSVLLIPTAVLINDFVVLFYGKEYQIGKEIILLLIVDAYITLAQTSAGNMVDAAGLFKEQKKFYYVGATINIVISVIGAITIGLPGVIIGTIVGGLYNWCKRAYYTYNGVIKKKQKGVSFYVKYNISLFIIFILIICLLDMILPMIMYDISVVNFVLKGLLSVLTILCAQVLIFGKREEFRYLLVMLKVRK